MKWLNETKDVKKSYRERERKNQYKNFQYVCLFFQHTLYTFFENETWLAKFLCADEDLKGKRGESGKCAKEWGVWYTRSRKIMCSTKRYVEMENFNVSKKQPLLSWEKMLFPGCCVCCYVMCCCWILKKQQKGFEIKIFHFHRHRLISLFLFFSHYLFYLISKIYLLHTPHNLMQL